MAVRTEHNVKGMSGKGGIPNSLAFQKREKVTSCRISQASGRQWSLSWTLKDKKGGVAVYSNHQAKQHETN